MSIAPIRRMRRRWLPWLLLTLGALIVLFGLVSGFYIDVLWFGEVGYRSVFWTRFWSRVLLGLAFGVLFFLLLYANLLIVRRIRPRFRQYTPEEETIERYRVAVEPHVGWLTPAVSALLALFAAVGVAAQWESFQLWRASAGIAFGEVDPVFGRDVAFYLLSFPFQRFVQGWLFTSLVVITLATAAAHYLWGGIRLRAIGDRVTPQVKAHLSVLLGLIVLTRAWGYRLGQFDLLYSARGTVTGASYTDVNAQLPALRLLMWIAVAVTVLFLINIRFRGWVLPIAGLGILVIASVVAGGIVPALVQRFQVEPQELLREQEYIARNIRLTRTAYGIDDVDARQFPADEEVTSEDRRSNPAAVRDIRLWNPDVLKRAYLQLQRIRSYYEFPDVDVDRYQIEGQRSLVMISPREIDQDGIPEGGNTWQNRHLFYTHGFGVTASRVDQVTPQGAPDFVVSNIPPSGPLSGDLTQPRLYFQERAAEPFLIVGADPGEFDFPRVEEGEEQLTRYDGRGGIQLSGLLRRLAFAWRFRDVNLLISDLIDTESRILINTDLRTRLQKIAPFLRYDHDPYIAIVNGRLTWIADAYTTSNAFPYSQRIQVSSGIPGGLEGELNYIRNSVKVAVDAYDGTTTFYVVDEEDPMIRAWQAVFPDLFTSVDEAPTELLEHFRYPEDLFRVQAGQYGNYHVTEPAQFYAKEDFWSIPTVVLDPAAPQGSPEATPRELEPYYVLQPLPGESEEEFLLFVPFTPADRPNMVAWLAAKGDPEDYGELVSFEFPARNVTGPPQAIALIQNDTEVAQQTTLFGQLGSEVIHGDILAIPVGSSFIYVQPLYLESQQAETGIPELKRVVVVNDERVSIEPTLAEALDSALGEEAPAEDEPDGEPTPPVEPTPPPDGQPPIPGDVAELLARAEEHFERAEQALQAGDLATYEREIEAARALVEQAARAFEGATG